MKTLIGLTEVLFKYMKAFIVKKVKKVEHMYLEMDFNVNNTKLN